MNYQESDAIDKLLVSAYNEVFNEDLDENTQMTLCDRFYDAPDATIFPDGENELDFEAGLNVATKYWQELDAYHQGITTEAPNLYRAEHENQVFYFIGTEKEILEKLNTVFNCCCPNETLMRAGCKCGGN